MDPQTILQQFPKARPEVGQHHPNHQPLHLKLDLDICVIRLRLLTVVVDQNDCLIVVRAIDSGADNLIHEPSSIFGCLRRMLLQSSRWENPTDFRKRSICSLGLERIKAVLAIESKTALVQAGVHCCLLESFEIEKTAVGSPVVRLLE